MTPRRFGDARGWFCETWNARTLAAVGIDVQFVQDNHSFSSLKGTLRGLHYQAPPHAQAKLVRCVRGSIWDVAVDVRSGSPRYGQWIAVELSAELGNQLWIPEGFLHGFATLTDDAEVIYKCTEYYNPEADGAVRWDSTDLGIDWRLNVTPEMSSKDADAPEFGAWVSPFAMDSGR